MKKLEFKLAMRSFGVEDRIGTYKIDDKKTDMYIYHDSIFYFGKDGKVNVIGNFPISLGYHIFVYFRGNQAISFENDNRGQWIKENVSLDPTISKEEGEKLLGKKLHRIYTISSLKALIAFLLFIDRYEKEKTAFDEIIDFDDEEKVQDHRNRVSKFDEQVEEYYINTRTTEEILTGLNLDLATTAPEIPDTYTIPKVKCNPQSLMVQTDIATFDYVSCPLQFSSVARKNYLSSLDKVDIEIDYNEDKTERTISMADRSSSTRTSYACTKNSIVYDGVIQTDELQHLRVKHIYTRYMPGMHMTGELIEITTAVSTKTTVQTARTTIYNITENLMFKDGKWYTPSDMELEWFAMDIRIVSSRIQDDIAEKLLSNQTIKFTPVNKELK